MQARESDDIVNGREDAKQSQVDIANKKKGQCDDG